MSDSFDWSSYDAERSMQMSFDQASKLLQRIIGQMPSDAAVARLAEAALWVQIAQVHATNAQTDAIKSAVKLTWQDDTTPL